MFWSKAENTVDGIDYLKLADRQDLIQKALNVKDWSNAADHAGRMLGLSRYEARALAAAEVNGSSSTTTRILWDAYTPHLYVWLPFAAIGVLATIALGKNS